MMKLRWQLFVSGAAAATWFALCTAGFAQTNFDLTLSVSNCPAIVSVGQYFTSSFVVAASGPDPAQDVVVTNRVPANLQFISARSTRGTCTQNAGVVTCTIDSIPSYSPVVVTLEFKATAIGSFTNFAGVYSTPVDLPNTNNGAAAVTGVTAARFFGVGRMNTNHAYPTCTLLPNGDYLVLGWYLTKQGERYNPTTRTFSRTGDLLVPRDQQGAGRLADGRVLVVGGGNLVAYGNGKLAEVFDPATGQFSRTAGDLNLARSSPRLSLQPDGRMLICGGAATNEVFNPATGTFSLDTTLPCPYDGIVLSTGKYLYFGYGRAYLYDPATGNSVETSGFIQPREKHTATLLPNGKVLVAGGRGTWGASRDTLSSAELYDPASDTFSHAAPLTAKRMYHSAALLSDGTVLLAGGRVSDYEVIPLDTAEIYDPTGTLNVPGVGVSDATVVEADTGTNYLQFSVWLTAPSASPVTVQFATAEGTARTVDWMMANNDFVHTNGTLTIPAGATNGFVYVPVRGDLIREPNETLSLSLANPTQAWIARATAIGTILDNDPLPSINLSPTTVQELDSGFTKLVYNVALSAQSLDTVSVDFFTANGTALAGSDYLTTTGSVVFGSGETAKIITVPVIGDLAMEPNEALSLVLTNPVNAVIGAGVAAGTILNDDGLAGAAHHLEILPVSNPQLQGVGFPVTVIARDRFGGTAANFNGLVRLVAETTNVIAANLGFEQPSLSPWVPFNNTPYEKQFQQVLFDVSGLGQPSTAMRTVAGGGTNGIMQDVFLTGGLTYTFKASFATEMFGDDMSWYGAAAYLQVGATNIAIGLPGGRPGSVGWTSGTLVYTPPTNGIYSLQVLIARDYYWGDALAVYIDDVQIACPVVEPSMVTNFVNGVWTGEVRVLQGATNVWLLADDGAGHLGAGNQFDVLATADLGISGSAYWVPTLRTGGELTFNLAVTNRGPATLTDAVVLCPMPANLTFLRATNKQGLVTANEEGVTWLVGPLAKGTNLTANIVMRADVPGPISNVFTFTSASTVELNPNDNSFSLTNQIWPPILTINSTSGTEAFASATGMVFNVTLASPTAQTVTSEYYTVDGSAVAGVDYVATNGVITFPPFTTNAAIRVYAIDDILDEPDRVFSVVLTNFMNAVIGYDTAGAWVYDDDLPPTISIAGTSVVEGDSGTRNAVFPLTMSKVAIADVTVRCTTSPGTADTNDYVHTVTTVTFPAGSTNATFIVPVRGNTVNEPDETFTVTLSLANGATIATGTATGTIINDDAVAGRLDHFEFGPVASPQFTNRPFQLLIRAVDYRGTNVNYSGTLPLVAQTDEYYTLRMLDDFEDGDLAGWTNYGTTSLVVSNVNDAAAGGYRSLRITGKASNPYPSYALRRLFTNSRPTRVSFAVRAAQTNAITGRIWGTAPGPFYLAFDFYMNKDGRMGLYSRNSFVGVPYVADRWYQVDLDLNWTTRLINCRIDGALAITNVAFPDDPYSGMSYIAVQNSENGTSWFDNIHVFDAIYTNLLVTPSNLSGFAGGTWTGTVAVARYGSNAYFTVTDTAEHTGRSVPFDMLPINLRWILPAAVTEGDGLIPAQLTMPLSFPQPITITLTSSLPAKVTVPASVIIPADQTNVAFNLTVLEDALLDGQQTAILSAASTNAVGASGSVLVNDNETAALTLTTPGTVAETAGTLFNQGRVTSSLPPARNITVTLASSDPTAVQVPSSVVIPAGQTVAFFSVVVVDDSKIDGPQFPAISASVPGWTNATNIVTVTDNEDTLLRISGPAQVSEGSGTASYTVRLSGTLATNLSLAASSTVPDRLSVPASVLLSAGQTSAVVTATIIDDSLFNGSAQATLTIQAPGLTSIFTNVTVLDNEVHHLSFSTITGARTSTVPFSVSVSARDIFDGPITAYNGPVAISGLGSGSPILLTTSNVVLSAGQWSGNLALFTAETLVALFALDTNGITGQSAFFPLLPPAVFLANINAADLVASTASDRLWALVSTNTTLVPVDPWRYLIETSVPAGAGANRLASSGDGRYAHIGRGQFVSRFDTLARAVDLTWSNQSLSIDDFAAVPGNSDSIAVSWMNPGYSPRGAGTQIYDAGVPRIPDGFGAGNAIEFSESPDLLYGYNNETSGFQFNLLQVGETNVVLRKTVSLMGYYGAHFTTVGKWIFATTGGIYDPERGIPVSGVSVTPVVGHTTWGRYFKFEPTPGRLVTYDLPTLLPVSSFVLPGVSNATGNMVRWGTNGLAFRANSAQVAILRSATVPSGLPADLVISSSTTGLPAQVSNTFSCTLVVSNQGPNTANAITLAHSVPTNALLTAAVPSSGSVTQLVNGAVSSFGDLAPGTVASVHLSFTGTLPGLTVIRASATSSSPDPNITNNVIDLPVSVGTQPPASSITEIRQVTSDLAWNPALGRIFASVPNSEVVMGSMLIDFDPLAGIFSPPIPTGLEPAKLAVSANGQYVYAGLYAEAAIQRIDASNHVADLKFPTGFGNAADMAVLPNDAHAVVATVHTMLVVYDNGIPRTNMVGPTEYNHPYYLAVVSPSTCYSTYPTGFRRIAIDAGGATLLSDTRDTVVTYQDWQIEYGDGRLFTPGGRVFDPVAGTNIAVVPYSGLVAPDEASGKVFYLTGGGTSCTLHALNITNLQWAGSVTITNISGTPSSLIRWGTDGLAFRTTGSQIFLIRTILADDRDQDGLPDTWELAHFGSLASGPSDDPDHDGFTNLQEQQAGFDPLVYDALRFVYGRPASGSGFEMAVIGNPGVSHTVSVSSNLVDWVPLFDFTCTNQPTIINDPSPVTGARFYRLIRSSGN